ALTMDLFLRRVADAAVVRVVLAMLWAFSPFVVATVLESHPMLAWVGILPLLALGAWDAVSDEPRRARRGQVLLGAALLAQFFLSTELLLLAVLIAALVAVVLAATAGVDRLVLRHTQELHALRAA